jgi:hypothetical protein
VGDDKLDLQYLNVHSHIRLKKNKTERQSNKNDLDLEDIRYLLFTALSNKGISCEGIESGSL